MADPSPSGPSSPHTAALARILRPLVRAMIARGLRFPDTSDLLKTLFVAEAEAKAAAEGAKPTDSRVSVLTGLQRRDVKAIRAAPPDPAAPWQAGPLPRVLARWSGDPGYHDSAGRPAALARQAGAGTRSFEELCASVTRDVHPRTLLDELVARGLVAHDRETDRVTLVSASFLAGRDEAALLGYFGANLGDHAEAAVANVLAAPAPGPFFERAVHYNRLSAESLDALDALARRLQSEVLQALNAEALARQDGDRMRADATGRFRCGAFVFTEPGTDGEETS
ncbi:MAG: hypothetical protein H6843_15150 [Rhodospirillaceae bacterium]|nr:hypothetical protein [Rhodospirillaceae bacterium]